MAALINHAGMGLQLSSFPSPLSDEQSLIDRQAAIRARLAASRRPLHWQGQGGITLYGEAFGAADAKRAVLLVCGRVESCIKYDELSDELVQLGFAVYRFDHRGQGLSGRLLTDHHKGHIDSYAAAVADLAQICASIRPHHRQLFLLAHSMGACISALLLQKTTAPEISAAAFCAPMVRLQSGKLPHWLAWLLVNLQHGLCQLSPRLRRDPPYFRQGGPYRERPFIDNHISHSAVRYQLFRATMAANPKAQLGDPTLAWVARSFRAAAAALANAKHMRTPLLVLAAGEDQLIDNKSIERFSQQAGGRYLCIHGARHELLFETDNLRQPALTAILDFFASHSLS